jgi:hypothetical protein
MDESKYLETHLTASHVDGEGEAFSEASQDLIEVRWRSYTWWKAGSRQIQFSKRSKLAPRFVFMYGLENRRLTNSGKNPLGDLNNSLSGEVISTNWCVENGTHLPSKRLAHPARSLLDWNHKESGHAHVLPTV